MPLGGYLGPHVKLLSWSGKFRPLEEVEREVIVAALAHCGGRMKLAAKILKIGRSTLYRKVDSYGIVRVSNQNT